MTDDSSQGTPFARVLCAIDYSDTSQHALAHAAQLARWYGARLTVLHVLPAYVIAATELPQERAMQEARQRATTEIATCGATVGSSPLEAQVVIEIGDPATVIVQQIKDSRADLLVLGTHGRSGVERFMMGSVAEKVLRKATCPVLTVPPRVHEASASGFERILCPVDFSDCSLKAFEVARSVAARTGGKVTLLHTIEWPWIEPPAPILGELPAQQAVALSEYRRYVIAEVTASLENLANAVSDARAQIDTRVAHGRAAQEIVKAAADNRSDLIVMGVHGRHALAVGLFGSVTHRVIRSASCPVLTTCA